MLKQFFFKVSKAHNFDAKRLAAAMALAMVSVATAKADSKTAADLLDLAGIPPHLEIAADSIAEEGYARYVSCLVADGVQPGAALQQAFTDMIKSHFGPEQSLARAVETMAGSLSDETMRLAREFFDTDVGKRIVKAEYDSKGASEDEFVEHVNVYVNSESWTVSRKQLINELLEHTRAVRFVSLINGEITVAVKVSSECDATEAGYLKLSDELKRERTDARFVEPIMAGELNLVIATVFRDLSDQEIQAYLEFASSPAGKSFFNGLLQSTRRGIAGGLSGVRTERIATHEGD